MKQRLSELKREKDKFTITGRDFNTSLLIDRINTYNSKDMRPK